MRKLFTLFLFLSTGWAFSQINLVNDSSFEITVGDSCPNPFLGDINYLKYWVSPTGYSPDYLSACDTNTFNNFSVPKNSYGFQTARTGVAYAGIITEFEGSGSGGICEYIQTALTDTLIAGKKYLMKFFTAVADSIPYASNNIGVYFSKTAVSSTTLDTLPYTPQVSNNPKTNPLDNRNVWTEVSDTFLAQGDEKYITIGNFNGDATTDTTNFPNYLPGHQYSYHYIDDVSVVCLDCAVGINNISINEKIKIFPNPSSGIFNIQFNEKNIKQILVYNLMGELILSSNDFNTDNISIDLSEFFKGLYFLKVRTKDSLFYKQLFLNN